MENIEEKKKKTEAFKMLIDMLAETGDARMVFVKEETDFHEKLHEISIDKSITDNQFTKLTSLLKQFETLIDDCLKEEEQMDYKQLQVINKSLKTTDIKGKAYTEVNQRILGFRQLYPNRNNRN